MARHQEDAAEVMVGLVFIGLFKCEEEECGQLFIKSIDYLFQIPGAAQNEQPPIAVGIECPEGHKKVKFIQSLDKTPLTVTSESQHG